MTTRNLKILCIEDDADTCELIVFVFNHAGYEVQTCDNAECLKLIRTEKFSAIILDNYFDRLSGADICRELRGFDTTTPVVFFSGEVRPSEMEKALAAGANAYLRKPDDFENLVSVVVKLIEEAPTQNFAAAPEFNSSN